MRNLMEEIVGREYQRLLPTVQDFCGCDDCRDDVMVYALNHLPPHYVTQRRGAVLQHVAMERDQSSADVSVALMAGFRIVRSSPRVDHAGGSRQTG